MPKYKRIAYFSIFPGGKSVCFNSGFIIHAESDDGIHFHRDGRICIQGNNLADRVFARPAVLLEDDLYKMWYTYRGETYRIGYAEGMDFFPDREAALMEQAIKEAKEAGRQYFAS